MGKLPTVEVQLSGEDGVRVGLSGTISQGRDGLITTFGAVPDVPVGRFRMVFPQGSDSALSYKGPSLCGRKVTFQATFTGQDGRTLQQAVPVQVTDCPVAILGAKRLKHGRLRVTVRVPAAGRVVLSGKTLRKASRTLKRPGIARITARFSRRGTVLLRRSHARRKVLRTAVGALFRPTSRDTGASALTTSRATRTLRLR